MMRYKRIDNGTEYMLGAEGFLLPWSLIYILLIPLAIAFSDLESS